MKNLLLISTIFLILNVFAIKQSFTDEIYNKWKCYSHFGDDAKLVLSIGYFDETTTIDENKNIRFMSLNTNNSKTTVQHYIDGINDAFNWGGKNYNDFKFIITAEVRSWLYDFRGVTDGQKISSSQTLNCKIREKVKFKEVDFQTVGNELGWFK